MEKGRQAKRKFHFKKPYNNTKRFTIQAGLKGFLCSCNFKERECVRESYNILNKYADLIFEPPKPAENNTGPSDDSQEDIEESLSKEINQLKSKEKSEKRRFQVIDSGAKNFLFISTTLTDPGSLVQAIVKDIFNKKDQQTKYLLRLIPVESTCRAHVEDIKQAVQSLLPQYFVGNTKTFSIIYNHRNNNSLSKDEVIKEVADLIGKMEDKHEVNLKGADLSVIIDIIRGFAFISIVPDYFKYKKYNLLNLSIKDEDSKQETGEDQEENSEKID